MSRSKTQYIKAFDGLRALSLLAVLFYHLSPRSIPQGFLAVVIFFVLAGYLCARNVLLRENQPTFRSPARWVRKRFLKLYPPLLLLLFTVTIVMISVPAYRSFLPRYPASLLSSLLVFNNQAQIFSKSSYFEMHGYLRPLTHLWALSLEMQFYILFANTFYRNYRKSERGRWSLICLVGALLSYLILFFAYEPGMDPSVVYYSLTMRLHAFLFGMLGALATIYPVPQTDPSTYGAAGQAASTAWTGFANSAAEVARDEASRNSHHRGAPFLAADPAHAEFGRPGSFSEMLSAILLIALIVGFFLPLDMSVSIRVMLPLYAILGTVLCVLVQGDRGRVALFLRFKPFPYLASRSYEIYLWHYPIWTFLSFEFAKTRVAPFWQYLAAFALSLVVAEVAWRLIRLQTKIQRRGLQSKLAIWVTMLTPAVFLLIVVMGIVLFFTKPTDTELMALQRHIEEQEARLLEEQQRAREASTAAKTQDTENQGDTAGEGDASGDAPGPMDPDAAQGAWTSTEPVTPVTVASDDSGLSEAERIQRYLDTDAETEAYQYFKEWFPLGGDYLISQEEYMAIRDLPISIIGDSLGVGISYATDVFLPNINFDVLSNRQLHEAPEILRQHISDGDLQSTVLIMLGTNGDVERIDLERVYDLLQGRQMLIATVILPGAEVERERNAAIRAFVADHPDVGLIDWYDQAKGITEIFSSDMTHTSIPGTRAYIQLICRALADCYVKPASS